MVNIGSRQLEADNVSQDSGPREIEVTHKIVSAKGAIDRIEGLGGFHDGVAWSLTAKEIIAEMHKSTFSRKWEFYVRDGEDKVPITVGRFKGQEILKTTRDAETARTLLALPTLPNS